MFCATTRRWPRIGRVNPLAIQSGLHVATSIKAGVLILHYRGGSIWRVLLRAATIARLYKSRGYRDGCVCVSQSIKA
jgi:hypothetical protein